MTAPKSTRASASLLPPELLQHILSNLSLPDVAAAAVTCRGWKEVALDILWSDVNLIDLLNVLAPTEVIGGGGVRGGLRFVRAISADDWSRFYNLAFRVRSGRLHSLLYASVIAAIESTRRSHSPLLPAVTHLDLRTKVNGHGLLFMGPTIDSLQMELLDHGDANEREQFFTQIPTLSPSITRFTLIDGQNWDPTDITKNVADLSRSLLWLRFIDLSQVARMDYGTVLSALAGCRFLEEIILWGDKETFQWSSAVAEPFLGLRRLTVIEIADSAFTSFLDSLEPNLTHVVYGYDDYSRPDGDTEAMVLAAARHRELEVLRLMPGQAGGGTVSPRILQSLYSLSRLRILSIGTDGPLEMTDVDITQLTSHLPRLQELKLLESSLNESATLPTLHALAIIVTSCPAIQQISLQMDTSLAEQPSGNSFTPSSTLRCVDVQQSVATDPKSVALFFERLTSVEDFWIEHGYDWQAEGPTGWSEVESLLQEAKDRRTEVAGHDARP